MATYWMEHPSLRLVAADLGTSLACVRGMVVGCQHVSAHLPSLFEQLTPADLLTVIDYPHEDPRRVWDVLIERGILWVDETADGNALRLHPDFEGVSSGA